MVNTDLLLLAVDKNYDVRIGLPPSHYNDDFYNRSANLGIVKNVVRIACSPDGELFCICGGDLYRGPMPSEKGLDWFSVATRVGKGEWSKVKLIFFHPNGELYCTTSSGEFYKGPPPDNEHVPWIYHKAKRIGTTDWEQFLVMCFDPEGILYAVQNTSKFFMGPPPNDEGFQWVHRSTLIGHRYWKNLSYFQSFSPDGKLWCVDNGNGKLYRGDPPVNLNTDYLTTAQCLGLGYTKQRMYAFTKDKTIHSILHMEFLTDEGKIVNQQPEVLEMKIYDNRESSSTLRHTFTVQKRIKESSTFSRQHGFTFQMGTEINYKTGIPIIAEINGKITVNMSTTHNWSFTETNETEVSFSSSTAVVLEPGKAIRMVASVTKAEMDVPYKARARTLFGSEVEIRGMWRGFSNYNLTVTQKDL